MTNFLFLQNSVGSGAVAAGGILPLGNEVTSSRRCGCGRALVPTTTGNNVVNVYQNGVYTFLFNGSLVATAAGVITVNAVVNGVVVASSSQTAGAAGDTVNITLPYTLRVFRCPSGQYPTQVQYTVTGGALTNATSSLTAIQIA